MKWQSVSTYCHEVLFFFWMELVKLEGVWCSIKRDNLDEWYLRPYQKTLRLSCSLSLNVTFTVTWAERANVADCWITWRWSDASKEGKRRSFFALDSETNINMQTNSSDIICCFMTHTLCNVSGLMLSLFSLCVVIAFTCFNKQRSGSVKWMSCKKKCVFPYLFLKLSNIHSIRSGKLF